MSGRREGLIETRLAELVGDWPDRFTAEIGPDAIHRWTVTLWEYPMPRFDQDGLLLPRREVSHWHDDDLARMLAFALNAAQENVGRSHV